MWEPKAGRKSPGRGEEGGREGRQLGEEAQAGGLKRRAGTAC